MALYDDKRWLLSNIRNSFISLDDTGMCELVMSCEKVNNLKRLCSQFPNEECATSSSNSSVESGDLNFSSDFCGRARTNTAARIEKIEQAKKRASKIKVIKWNSRKNEHENSVEMFEKVDPKTNVKLVKKSLLSLKLEECVKLPKNPYLNYAKYDGIDQINVPTRKYKIILTILKGEVKNTIMNISCIATAKIMDLIGLILFNVRNRYSNNTNLHPVTHYGLYITEEDGEIYYDLPPLDSKECVAKFGFTCLALVELKDPLVTFEEKQQENTENVSKDSTSETKQNTDLDVMAVHKKAMEAPFYQSYQVYFVSKLRSKIEVHLGISGDKIEIDPIQPQHSKFSILHKLKPVSCNMDSIAWCEVLSGHHRSGFRVLYSNSERKSESGTLQASVSFKHFDFEADNATAVEIVEKINLILDLRSSQSRKEYLAAMERKRLKPKKTY